MNFNEGKSIFRFMSVYWVFI